MKQANKNKFLTIMTGTALVLLSLVSNTAAADYKGYWLDTVRDYQANYPRAELAAAGDNQANSPAPAYPVYQPAQPQQRDAGYSVPSNNPTPYTTGRQGF